MAAQAQENAFAARRLQRTAAYDELKDAIQAAGHTYPAVLLLDVKAVRTLIGEKARGMSQTLIRNMQRKALVELKRAELQSAADWILSRILSQFPGAEVKIRRGRVIELWLDGVPEEVE